MNIPYGFPRVAFVVYILVAVVTFCLLGLLALSEYPFARVESFLFATFWFGAILIKGAGGMNWFANECRAHPVSTSIIAIAHALMITVLSIGVMLYFKPGSSGVLFIAVAAIPLGIWAAVFSAPKLVSWFGFGVTKDKYQLRDK